MSDDWNDAPPPQVGQGRGVCFDAQHERRNLRHLWTRDEAPAHAQREDQ